MILSIDEQKRIAQLAAWHETVRCGICGLTGCKLYRPDQNKSINGWLECANCLRGFGFGLPVRAIPNRTLTEYMDLKDLSLVDRMWYDSIPYDFVVGSMFVDPIFEENVDQF